MFLSTRCKYCLHSRKLVFVIIADATRLWKSSRFSQYISCLNSLAYPLTKRIVRKSFDFLYCHGKHVVTFQTGIINLFNAYSLQFSICQENNSCGNRLLWKTGTGSLRAFNCCQAELSNCFQLADFFRGLKTKSK